MSAFLSSQLSERNDRGAGGIRRIPPLIPSRCDWRLVQDLNKVVQAGPERRAKAEQFSTMRSGSAASP